jgi:hypothetical protein
MLRVGCGDPRSEQGMCGLDVDEQHAGGLHRPGDLAIERIGPGLHPGDPIWIGKPPEADAQTIHGGVLDPVLPGDGKVWIPRARDADGEGLPSGVWENLSRAQGRRGARGGPRGRRRGWQGPRGPMPDETSQQAQARQEEAEQTEDPSGSRAYFLLPGHCSLTIGMEQRGRIQDLPSPFHARIRGEIVTHPTRLVCGSAWAWGSGWAWASTPA